MIKIIENLNLTEDNSKDNENRKFIKNTAASIINDMKAYQKEVDNAKGKPLSDLKFLLQHIFKQLGDFKYQKESINLNEFAIRDEKWPMIERIQNEIYGENYEAILIALVKFLPLETIKNFFNSIMQDYDIHMDEELDEATSGIGAGNYSTGAIDIKPNKIKIEASKETEEEKNKIDDNVIVTKNEVNFYGKVFTNDKIKEKVDFAKENPDTGYLDDSEFAWPSEFKGKIYYLLSEPQEINIDDIYSTVYLAADEDYKRYLVYYEIEYYDDGDGESGPHLTEQEANEPYKVVEI